MAGGRRVVVLNTSAITTLKTYGHLWPSLGAQLDEKIDWVLVRGPQECGLDVDGAGSGKSAA
jgi:hypothetical protein